MAQTARFAPGHRSPRPGAVGSPGSPGKVRLSTGRSGLLAALLLALVALTGCVTVQLNATVHPDGTLSGTARYGVAKTLAAFAGGEKQLLDQLKSEGSCDFGDKQGTTKDFDDGTYIGIDCAFDHVTMAEFNSGEEGPKLTKTGDEFHLTGTLNLLQALSNGSGLLGSTAPSGTPAPSGIPTDLSSLLPSDLVSLLPSGFPTDLSSLLPSGIPTDLSSLLPSGIPTDLSSLLPSGVPTGGLPGLDPSDLLKTAKVSFAFTFPGKVKSTKGKVDGHKVIFVPDSHGNIDFQTTASATPSSSSGPGSATWIVLAVVILALLAAAGLLLRRRRAAAARTALAAGYPQPGYPQPGYYPYAGDQYPTQQYPAQQYPPPPGQPYPTQQYPAQQPPPTQQYPAQPYPAPPGQQYPAQPYQGEQYPTQQYPVPEQPWSAPTAEPNPWSRPVEEPPAGPDRQEPDNSDR